MSWISTKINSSKACTQLSPIVGKPAQKPQLPLCSARSSLVPWALGYECPQAAPGTAHSYPSQAPGFPPFASPIEIYSCRTLIFISWQGRKMTQASFNLRIFLILLWFAALPAFPSSRILFPLHHLRHVEPIEEQPHARKSQTISKHNIFRKPSSAAVRFPLSVVAGSENFRTPHHSNMKILVGYSSRTNANTPK